MTPAAVVLDIGNVLIEWQPERFYDRVIGPERRRAMFEAVDLLGMNDLVDLGGHFTDTIYAMADCHPDWREEIRMWHDRWIELATPEIPGSVRLLRALRGKRVPVFALSNFGRENFETVALPHYPFLAEFDRSYISGRLRVAKPDPRIYEIVERDSGIPPGALLFVDDRQDNIDAARARGWQTHLFRDPAGWADALVAAGLLTREEIA